VHLVRLGERKCPTNKARQPLTQDAIEPLHMARLSVAFACGPMLGGRQNTGISPPEVGEQHALFVDRRNAPPQQAARPLPAPADGISHDLAGSSALGQPDPPFVLAAPHKRPEFIETNDQSSSRQTTRVHRVPARLLAQAGQVSSPEVEVLRLFLSHVTRV